MTKKSWLRTLPLAIVALALVVTAAAWQTNPGNSNQNQPSIDTTPQRKIKDIDEAIAELEKARIELEKTLGEKKWETEMKASLKEFDADKIRAEIDAALKEVDAAKIQAQVQKSMADVDFEKIKKELQESLGKVDGEKMKAQVELALKEVDAAKIQAQVMASVDFEKMKAEMQRVKEIDFKKIEEEMKNMGPKIEASMKEARESMEKAKEEMLAYKGFIDGLEKDGLIKKDQPYTIIYKNKELTINGQKQPASVTSKYQSFLEKKKDFTITKDSDDFNIDND